MSQSDVCADSLPSQVCRPRKNALIDVADRSEVSVSFTVSLPSGTRTVTFYMRRVIPGQSVSVQLAKLRLKPMKAGASGAAWVLAGRGWVRSVPCLTSYG